MKKSDSDFTISTGDATWVHGFRPDAVGRVEIDTKRILIEECRLIRQQMINRDNSPEPIRADEISVEVPRDKLRLYLDTIIDCGMREE